VIGQVVRAPELMKKRFGEEVESGRWSAHSPMGISGIESAFEPFLHSEAWNLLAYTATNTGRPLNGVALRTKTGQGAADTPEHTLITTLDRDIQHRVENILRDEQVKDGAAVVQEIATGNILAMASQMDESGSKAGDGWINRAVTEKTPGSIFKTVVSIAALEEGIVRPDSEFHCDGHWETYNLRDSGQKGHGKQTFAQAFANSCNLVMGQVAMKLGAEKLEAYAKRLGLGQNVIWKGTVFQDPQFSQLPEEQSGVVFKEQREKKDPWALVRTAIGQQSVRVTPVQAADLVTALFHGGRPPQPRLVTEIRAEDGRTIWKFDNRYMPGAKPVREDTLRAVRMMMRGVVTQGTARSINGGAWKLAGKTGTAETGTKEHPVYNKWMIGFGPWEKPRYSVAVVLVNITDPDDPRAKRIFRRIMEELSRLEKAEITEVGKEKSTNIKGK
jgi:cell division protein FtsI/penicillin-binding protein 2